MSTVNETCTGDATTVEPRLHADTLTASDRRTAKRVSVSMPVSLIDTCGDEAVRCSMTCVAEGGVHVRVPATSGVSLGRRFELHLLDGAIPPELTSLRDQTLYATVIRTERTDRADTMGVGMRFDQPLFL